MATVIKPRTAIIIALTVIAVAVSSLVLLPRWRAAAKAQSSQLSRTNPESLRDQFKPLAAFLSKNEDLQPVQAVADDREAMWKSPQAVSHASGLGNEKPKLPKFNVLEKVPVDYKASVLTTTSSITSPVGQFRFTNPSSSLPLPSMKRGSVEIRPERLPPPVHSSDIYISLLTAPKFHDTRVSLQYLTWLQTIDPKQVSSVHDRKSMFMMIVHV